MGSGVTCGSDNCIAPFCSIATACFTPNSTTMTLQHGGRLVLGPSTKHTSILQLGTHSAQVSWRIPQLPFRLQSTALNILDRPEAALTKRGMAVVS
jgi:hypothetical protein